jgi:UDP-galactopyranose mutase
MTDEEKVVLTEDGKPMAIAVSVVGKDFEKFLSYIQRAEAIEAFYALGREAAIKGIDMSDEEIERAIGEIRRAERK